MVINASYQCYILSWSHVLAFYFSLLSWSLSLTFESRKVPEVVILCVGSHNSRLQCLGVPWKAHGVPWKSSVFVLMTRLNWEFRWKDKGWSK